MEIPGNTVTNVPHRPLVIGSLDRLKLVEDGIYAGPVRDLPGVLRDHGNIVAFRIPPDHGELETPIRVATQSWALRHIGMRHGFQMTENAPEQVWLYRKNLFLVEGADSLADDKIAKLVKHTVLKDERASDEAWAKIERELDVFETPTPPTRRPILEDVKMFVWRRDEGRCVQCGAKEKLEYDHIIPVSKGGGSTARNVQILCESCNRAKGSTI